MEPLQFYYSRFLFAFIPWSDLTRARLFKPFQTNGQLSSGGFCAGGASDDFKLVCGGSPARNHLEAYFRGDGPPYKSHLIG
jgi:hypothetical protein